MRLLAGRQAMNNTIDTARAMIADRDTETGIATAMNTTGTHRRQLMRHRSYNAL
jgi:hypothetical protein